MRLILLVPLISLVMCAPFSTDYEETSDDIDLSFKDVKLGSKASFAWKIVEKSLLVSIRLSTDDFWLVIGFTDPKTKKINQLNDAIFFRIRNDHLSVKVGY